MHYYVVCDSICPYSLPSNSNFHQTCIFLVLFLGGDHDKYYLEGLMESPSVDDDVDCFSPMLLNATSVNVEVYYNKAVNYTLMVTFVSFAMFVVFFLFSSSWNNVLYSGKDEMVSYCYNWLDLLKKNKKNYWLDSLTFSCARFLSLKFCC